MQAVAGDGVEVPAGFQLRRPGRLREPDRRSAPVPAADRFRPAGPGDARAQAADRSAPAAPPACWTRWHEVLAPGIVVTSDPLYYIYADALERRGFEVLACRKTPRASIWTALERKLCGVGDRVADLFFYVVTVNNPSCTVLSNARRRALLEVAAQAVARAAAQNPDRFRSCLRTAAARPERRAIRLRAARRRDGHRLRDRHPVEGAGAGAAHRLPAGPGRSAHGRHGAANQRRRFQRAAVRAGDGRLSARHAHRGTTARRQRGLSGEGGRGGGRNRAQPGPVSGGVPRRQRGLLLLPDLPRSGDASGVAVLQAPHASTPASRGSCTFPASIASIRAATWPRSAGASCASPTASKTCRRFCALSNSCARARLCYLEPAVAGPCRQDLPRSHPKFLPSRAVRGSRCISATRALAVNLQGTPVQARR